MRVAPPANAPKNRLEIAFGHNLVEIGVNIPTPRIDARRAFL
jgi:hypothetical protein